MAVTAAAAAAVIFYNMNASPDATFNRGQTTTIQAYQIDQLVA